MAKVEKNDIQVFYEKLNNDVKNIQDIYTLNLYNNAIEILKKYIITEQNIGANKLRYLIDLVASEKEIVDLGISKFVYRDDIELLTKDSNITLVDLKEYTREIPDEAMPFIKLYKNHFDKIYVLAPADKNDEKVELNLLGGLNKENVADSLYLIRFNDRKSIIDSYIEYSKINIIRHIGKIITIDDLRKELNRVECDELKNFYIKNDDMKSDKFNIINFCLGKFKKIS